MDAKIKAGLSDLVRQWGNAALLGYEAGMFHKRKEMNEYITTHIGGDELIRDLDLLKECDEPATYVRKRMFQIQQI